MCSDKLDFKKKKMILVIDISELWASRVFDIKWQGRFMVKPNRRVIFQKVGSSNIVSLKSRQTVLMFFFLWIFLYSKVFWYRIGTWRVDRRFVEWVISARSTYIGHFGINVLSLFFFLILVRCTLRGWFYSM